MQGLKATDVGCGADGTTWTVGTASTQDLVKFGFDLKRLSGGENKLIWATNTQRGHGKDKLSFELVMKSKQFVINAFMTPEPPKLRVWSSGKFACANQLVLSSDGNLVLSCD